VTKRKRDSTVLPRTPIIFHQPSFSTNRCTCRRGTTLMQLTAPSTRLIMFCSGDMTSKLFRIPESSEGLTLNQITGSWFASCGGSSESQPNIHSILAYSLLPFTVKQARKHSSYPCRACWPHTTTSLLGMWSTAGAPSTLRHRLS